MKDDPITLAEIQALFGADVPTAGYEMLFPETAQPLTRDELRRILRMISTSQMQFQHRLIENAFSWALQDCNYLNPKYMNRLIAETIAGMKPEQAAQWNATAREIAGRREKFS